MSKKEILTLLKDKRVQWAVTGVLLFVILLWSSSIRLSNWDLLTDQTTGEKIPLALDPFYFLRHAETIVEQGSLPEIDSMRYPSANISSSTEFLPKAMVGLYRFANIFGDYTLREVVVFSPVFYFFVAMIFFFFLVYVLTDSKIVSLLSTLLLSFIPSFLYRTLAGFSDHEAIGIMIFFATMLIGSLFFKEIDKNGLKLKEGLMYSLLLGLFTALTISSWGGIAVALFAIIPLSFFLIWLFNVNNKKDKKFCLNLLLSYISWFFGGLIFSLFLGLNLSSVLSRFIISTSGMIGSFVLLLILVDFLILTFFKDKLGDLRELYSLLISLVLGFFGMIFIGKNPFDLFVQLWGLLIHPFGTGRVGQTIAENAQPYLIDWINQTGKILFVLFVFGVYFIGLSLSKGVRDVKKRVLFFLSWIFMTSSIIFSRVSSDSLFNGTNFISQLFYLSGVLTFVGYFIYLYLKKEINMDSKTIFLASWAIFMIVAGRAAARMFFAIVPFVCFSAGYLTINLKQMLAKTKDELWRILIIASLIIISLLLIIAFNGFLNSTVEQAKYTGPSANEQWQRSMEWVRNNTSQGSIFLHWWDYGHWVTALGKRPVVTDGGHAIDYWDHLIGRYLLTTPYPKTAYSFMKTHNVSYLLIDPTDLGKYGAYSLIGSDESGKDRYDGVPVMAIDERLTKETSSGKTRVYQGGMYLSDDISYQTEEGLVFLPQGKAAIIGTVIETKEDSMVQPKAVYLYNNKQTKIPLRYVYINNTLLDFGSGLEAIAYIIPSFDGQRINQFGAVLYLSPKVSSGLFARIYLLDNAFKDYDSLELVHTQSHPFIENLRQYGYDYGEFLYTSGTFIGPIKIWKADYPEDTQVHEEFLRTSGGWGELDNLEFVA